MLSVSNALVMLGGSVNAGGCCLVSKRASYSVVWYIHFDLEALQSFVSKVIVENRKP